MERYSAVEFLWEDSGLHFEYTLTERPRRRHAALFHLKPPAAAPKHSPPSYNGFQLSSLAPAKLLSSEKNIEQSAKNRKQKYRNNPCNFVGGIAFSVQNQKYCNHAYNQACPIEEHKIVVKLQYNTYKSNQLYKYCQRY